MGVFDSRAYEIIAENFRESSAQILKDLEMRLGLIDSTCSLGNPDGRIDPGDAELMGMYKASLQESVMIKPGGDLPERSVPHIEAYASSTLVADVVTLSRMLLEEAERTVGYSHYDLLEPEHTEQELSDVRIAYRKAHGADIAFEKFVSLIPDAAALYRDTFPAVCDAVALGDADMCILPYENTEDGKLSSFYRLIESYDLKIAASVLVRSDRRDDMTRYLLLSQSLAGLSMLSGVTDFEFSLADRADGALTRTLAAAYLLKLDVRSIDTVRAEKDVTVYDIRVTASDRALDEFILYLKLEAADFSPLGLYAVIDEENNLNEKDDNI
ncbi:MAG: hypothetical protein IJ391_08910 [Clostridia bacterium]|nr:hypothetical protein [Clostridia bacterium]